jgi:Uma2 family endonuclease
MSIQHATADAGFQSPAVSFEAVVPPVRRFTVDEYHRMIDAGILGANDRVELDNGWIVEISPIGPPHVTSVNLIAGALQDLLPVGWTIRAQSPITLETGEPEPVLVVARGKVRDYSVRHPFGADIGLLIEVADDSLQFDRAQKRLEYANANIAEYWIVNLVNRCVEVHRSPSSGDYSEREIIGAEGALKLNLAGQCAGQLSVADLLP